MKARILHGSKKYSLLTILLLAFLLGVSNIGWGQTQTFTSNGTFTVPAGVTSVTVECWGGGGAGGGQNLTSDGGGGGGGGAYSKKLNISVTPGNNYNVYVGAGGIGAAGNNGGNGGDSYFINTTTVLAKGGLGGSQSTGTPPPGGLGGDAAAGVGDTKYSGGQGEKGRDHNTGQGGYGGSSAGTGANGWSGPQTWSTVTYPTANTPTGAGHGGNGGNASADGSAPASGNGGGGGGSGDGTNRVGGNGAGGKVIVSWTCPVISTFPYNEDFSATLNSCWSIAQVSGTGNWTMATSINYPGIVPVYTLNPQSGSHLAKFDSYNFDSGTVSRLRTSVFDFTSLSSPSVEFYIAQDGQYTNLDKVEIQASTNGGGTWTTLSPAYYRYDASYTTPGWKKITAFLPAYANTNNVTLAFLATSAYGNMMAIDNVTVKQGITDDVGTAGVWAPTLIPNEQEYPWFSIVQNYAPNTETFDVETELRVNTTAVSTATVTINSLPYNYYTIVYGSYDLSSYGSGNIFDISNETKLVGDQNTSNDLLTNSTRSYVKPVSANDTIYAWDDGTIEGSVGYNTGTGWLGQLYFLSEQDTLTSVTVNWGTIPGNVSGNSIEIYNVTSGIPSTKFGDVRTGISLTTADQGTWKTYKASSLIILPAGTYWIGVHQSVALAGTYIMSTDDTGLNADNYLPGFAFYSANGTAWTDYAASGLNTINMIRINFADVTLQAITWTGTTNTSWNLSGNWSSGFVPNSNHNVIIPSTVNKPVISTSEIIKSLTINSGGVVTIGATASLSVRYALNNNAGTDGLIIKSDASGTGSLISSTTGVDAKVERFLTKMKWHFIGMPVESGVAGVFHLPSGHADIYLKPHIEMTNTWGGYIVPVTDPLEQGKGYECWVGDPLDPSNQMDETIVFPGKLGAGDYTTGSGGFYGLTYTGTGYNFTCNPYPSALEGSINSWTKTNVDNSIWVWQGTGTTILGGGNYLFWNGTTGSLTNGIIPSMQGFFVHANNTGASLTIPQSSRVHDSQLFYKDSGLPLNTLRLDVEGNGFSDAVFVCFNEQATEDYDPEYDVRKLYGLNEAPQLYTVITGDELSINVLPDLGDNRIVEIGFECGVSNTFTINASGMNGFDEHVEFYLEDLKSGTAQNLKENPVYLFNGVEGDEPSRFRLHFGNPNTVEETVPNPISIYAENNKIHILNLTQGQVSVYVYDLMGRQVAEKQVNCENTIGIKVETETGYYLIKVQTGEQFITQKVFIK